MSRTCYGLAEEGLWGSRIFTEEKTEAIKSDYVTLWPNDSLKNILQTVSDRFAAESNHTEIWRVYLLANELDAPGENIGVSHGMACIAGNVALGNWLAFGGMFICPSSSDRYVSVNAFLVYDDNSTPVVIKGIGASNYSTAFVGSDAHYRSGRDALTKATIAAIAHTASELVAFYNTKDTRE